MKYINDKKENIYSILRVLIILHFCVVSNGQGCQGKPEVVASCPQSAYDWIMHAKVVCTVSNNYHCLITENHRDDKQSLIECCMKPQNITRGHMPRYNQNKNELQEIECQEDYYMPTQFLSNRYRDHDVQHCKYMKTNCNMEGMKICNHGSTTTDRKCYCDYKELYVPELPLDRGEHCFSVKDNVCSLRKDCDRTYQELNMMYQCVNVCKTGYFRPENEIICRLLPEGTTVAGKVTAEVSVPDIIKPTLKTSTPTTSTKDNMVKPEMENQGTKNNHIIAIGVGVVCIATTIGGFVIVVYLLRRYRKGGNGPHFCCTFGNIQQSNIDADTLTYGHNNKIIKNCKFKVQDEESRLLQEIEVQKEKYREVYGSEVVLKVKISFGVRSIYWFYKDHDDNPQLIPSDDSRYSEFNILTPSLKINNLCKQSAGSYICKVTMDNEEETPIESRKIEVEVIEPVLNLKKTLIDVEYGREVTLECEILDCPKYYELYWEKDVDENVKELKINDETKEKYSGCTKTYPNLTIKDADHGDNALYCFCIKYQPSTDECEIFRSSSKIKVHVVNEPSVEMIKNTKDVFIGDNISFGCIINHRPKKFEVIWEKIAADNEEISRIVIFDEKTKDKYESYNDSNKPHLTIKDAEESDDALYRCFIRYFSSVGEQIAISDKIRLHVKEKEPVIAGDTHNIGTYIEDLHQMNTGLKSVDIQRFTRRASDSSSSADFNGFKAEKYPKVDDQAENIASRNGASASNGPGSENQHAEHLISDIDILSRGNRQKLRNLNPEEDSCFSEMERIAGLHGYVVKNVHADGNCLFHAISHYIGDQISEHPLIGEQKAKELRIKTVQYLEKNDTTPNGEKYSSFLEDQINDQNGDKWSQYLNSMKQQGTYGDELILRAISHHFSVHISVLSTESPERFSKYNPVQRNEQTKNIHLGFIHANRHYVRLENKEALHQQPSKNESSV